MMRLRLKILICSVNGDFLRYRLVKGGGMGNGLYGCTKIKHNQNRDSVNLLVVSCLG